jgi:hypothetical protein
MRSGAPVRKLKLASGGRGEVRHRVTAEIVVVAPEDIEDYQAFEAAIIAPRRRGARAGAPACIAVVAHASCQRH